MRTAVRSLIYGILAFLVTAVPAYFALWRIKGLDRVTPDDGPLVVVLAIWCFRWSAIIGFISALVVVVLTVLRSRTHRSVT